MTEAKQKSVGSVVRRPLLAAALAASAATAAPAPALAAIDMYLKLDNLAGESTNAAFPGWINVNEYQVGFDAGMLRRGPGAGGGAVGKASCSEFKITKRVDMASPALLLATMSGKHFQKADIEFLRTGDGAGVFLKYELQDVIVSSLGGSGARGDDNPTETLSLNFAKATIRYSPMTAKADFGDWITSTVNCP
jgi:type VI secretion system secreted protein Hcp